MIDDLTSNGYVRRWSFVSGEPRCVEDAVPANDAGAVPALQRNAAVRAMVEAVTAYETALRVLIPDEGADTADYDAAQSVIASASDVTKALASMRAGDEADTAAIDDEIDHLSALPLVVDPRPVDTSITWLEFLDLFNLNERVQVATSSDPYVAYFRMVATGLGGDMHINDPRVAQGLDALIAAGLINADRKAKVLARIAP